MIVRDIRRTNQVYVEYEVADVTGGQPQPFDPDTANITIRNPAGAIVVNSAAMTRVQTGRWKYQYQTTSLSPLGYWTGEVTVHASGRDALSLIEPIFNLVA